MPNKPTPVALQSTLIDTPHGFFTRQGGVSTGLYQSLNLGRKSDDTPEKVEKNRHLISLYFNNTPLLTPSQIHSNQVICLHKDTNIDAAMPQDADALVTNRDDITIGVLSADCTPVLLYDPQAKIIGAAHAGWRGALNGIVQNTINSMVEMGATQEHLIAAIGPCISQENYEVDTDFYDNFCATNTPAQGCFIPAQRHNHWLFNLPAYIYQILQQARCHKIESLNQCTYANNEMFFSYRRSCHRQEKGYGRQISAISLKNR